MLSQQLKYLKNKLLLRILRMMELVNLKMNSSNLGREIRCSKLPYLRCKKLRRCLIQVAILREIQRWELKINKIWGNYRIDTIDIQDFHLNLPKIIGQERFKVIELFIIYQKDLIQNQTVLMIVLNQPWNWKDTRAVQNQEGKAEQEQIRC